MTDRSLITTGAIGAALAAICCATPILAVVLGGIGLSAWLAKADYIVMPVLLLGVALVGLGLYRRTPRRRVATRPSKNRVVSEQR
jgi:mercuric ion transport protein